MEPLQRLSPSGHEVRRQLSRAARGRGQGPHHHGRAERRRGELTKDQMAQAAADTIAHHRVAHRLGHHEAHLDSVSCAGSRGVNDERRPSSPRSLPYDVPKLLRAPHSGGPREHSGPLSTGWQDGREVGQKWRVRQTGRRGPCADERREWSARLESASADGSRECGCDAGCWAGKCAWSRESSHILEATSASPLGGQQQGAK